MIYRRLAMCEKCGFSGCRHDEKRVQWGGSRIPGPGKKLGPAPKPSQEKGVLLKLYPPKWLYDLIRAEAERTGKSMSEVGVEAIRERMGRANNG